MNRLSPILDARRQDVATAAQARPMAALEAALLDAPAQRPFAASLSRSGVSIIAEVKRRSPSEGTIADGLSAADQASAYADAGARAISVLTESAHFGGSADDLVAVRAQQRLPVLRKDFVVDPYQLIESRVLGADAVLLIVAALGAETGAYLRQASTLGLEALVEVHDEREMDIALDAGAEILGVNNRDLTDLSVDLGTFERLASRAPKGVLLVAESGVHDRADAARMRRAGADALLVGTALMRAPDPGLKLRELLV